MAFVLPLVLTPVERARNFLRQYSRQFYDGPTVNISQSAQLAALGDLAGAVTLQGVPVNGGATITGLVMYTPPGASGSLVSPTLLSRVWTYAPALIGNPIAQNTYGPPGEAVLPLYSVIARRFAFNTTASIIAVSGGAGNAACMVTLWIDQLDGFGYRLATRQPFPGASGLGGTLYFDLGDGIQRKIALDVQGIFGGIGVRAGDFLTPYDDQRTAAVISTLGDSIAGVGIEMAGQFGSSSVASFALGGTGYVKPNLNAATANSNLIAASGILSSASGNIGWQPGALPGGDQATTQDGHPLIENELAPVQGSTGRTGAQTTEIVSANPDVVLVLMGLNDYMEAERFLPSSNGWSMTSALAVTLQRLRAGLPNSLLIVSTPWAGNRSVNGYGTINANYTAISNAVDLLPGPWLFVSTVGTGDGLFATQWRGKRENGSVLSGTVDVGPITTGTGNTNAPTGIGNADYIFTDGGPHPSVFPGGVQVTAPQTLDQTPATLEVNTTLFGLYPNAGSFSLQSAADPPISYRLGVTVNYTGKTPTTITGCTIDSGSVNAGVGDRVYMLDETGQALYARKISEQIIAAMLAWG